jgi:hypothetical protein
VTRTYSWSTANPTKTTGTKTVTATNNAGLVSNTTNATNPITLSSDTTAPSRAFTFPASSGKYNATTWAAGCSPIGICGASSDTKSGVAIVQLTIQRTTDNFYWDGAKWQSGSATLTAAGTTSWNQTLDASALTTGASYTVTVWATDNLGNQSTTTSRTFRYDNVAPVVTITSLVSGGGVSKIKTSGTATVGDGNVTIYLCDTAPCSAANAVYTATATVNSSGNWSNTSGDIGNGTYYATAKQTDATGNVGWALDFGPFVR